MVHPRVSWRPLIPLLQSHTVVIFSLTGLIGLAICSEFWESVSGASSTLLIIFLLASALPSAADACPVIGYSASSLSSAPWLHLAHTKAEARPSSSPFRTSCLSFLLTNFSLFPPLSLQSTHLYAAYSTVEFGSR